MYLVKKKNDKNSTEFIGKWQLDLKEFKVKKNVVILKKKVSVAYNIHRYFFWRNLLWKENGTISHIIV